MTRKQPPIAVRSGEGGTIRKTSRELDGREEINVNACDLNESRSDDGNAFSDIRNATRRDRNALSNYGNVGHRNWLENQLIA